jgi:iron complex outermembrane receptor protein
MPHNTVATRYIMSVTLLIALGLSADSAYVLAAAPRVTDNVVTSADDAFGLSLGRESIGLYTASSVRGFSPVAAGNARIDGLYFDQVWNINARLRRTSTVRVGISAQGYPFPAPTGIVDYALIRRGNRDGTAVVVGGDAFGAAYLEADSVSTLIPERFGLVAGAGLYQNVYATGVRSHSHNQGLALQWRPTTSLEIMPFFGRSQFYNEAYSPLYLPAGSYLPPALPQRQFKGPSWAAYNGVASNVGTVSRWRASSTLLFRLGLFHSRFDDKSTFTNLISNLQPDGSASRVVIADPPSKLHSTSGEWRASRTWTQANSRHTIHLNLTGRVREKLSDGSVATNFGATTLASDFEPPKPAFRFGERTHDEVRQSTVGVAYELRWGAQIEAMLGLQQTHYRKNVTRPSQPTTTTSTRLPIHNGNVAWTINSDWVVFGSLTRGLEESGVAPDTALNRGQALAAIETTQRDLGLRYRLTPEVKLIAGLFEVKKPYYNLDESRRFTLLGDVQHRGIELSVSGKLNRQLTMVAGAVLMQPRVSGEGVAIGRVSSRPVGQTTRNLKLNVDWSIAPGMSLDGAVSHLGNIVATRDNTVSIPARTQLDFGVRYRFQSPTWPTSVRLSVTNAFNRYGLSLQGSGAYTRLAPRLFSIYVTYDV